MTDDLNRLRERLVFRRYELGRSQVDVARRMGATQSVVSELESGHVKNPGVLTLTRWAAAVDLTLSVHLSAEQPIVADR